MVHRRDRKTIRKGGTNYRAGSSAGFRHTKSSAGRDNESTPSAEQLLVGTPSKTLLFVLRLKIFAGAARFSRALSLIGFAVVPWDVTKGPQHDLLIPANRHRILGWIRSGLISCIHTAPQCGTFSRIRDRPNGSHVCDRMNMCYACQA